jgi:hypothetical protein
MRTPEAELVLRSLRPQPPAAELRSLAAGPLDDDAVVALALEHGVGTLVANALEGADASLPRALPEDRRAGERRGLALTAETARLIRALEAGGVPALPLKGVALSVTAYGSAGVRRSGDIDLLVRPGDLTHAGDVLAAAGYAPLMTLDDYERRWYAKTMRQLPPLARPGGLKVEVHATVDPPRLALDLDTDAVFARARPVTLETGKVHAPSPEDALTIVASHALRSGWNRLEWAACVAWLAQRPDMDWGLAARIVTEAGGARMLALALAVARDVVGAAVPAGAARLVHADARARRLALRLGEEPFWAMPSFDEHHADLRIRRLHLEARERRRDRARYLRVALLTPTLAEAQRLRVPRALSWLRVPVRWARLTWRGARAVAR